MSRLCSSLRRCCALCVSLRASQRTLIALASLSVLACGRDSVVLQDAIDSEAASSAGQLEGTVVRGSGAPAQGLVVTALNHGAVVISTSAGGAGEFRMLFVYPISQLMPGDTLLTFFIQARTAVGAVSDSLVLREAVQVRMSRNLSVPVVTRVELKAAY
jgi:hypothetical protein